MAEGQYSWAKVVGAVALPNVGGLLGAYISSGDNINVWYKVTISVLLAHKSVWIL